MSPDLQKLLRGTGSCKSTVADKESTQAQYEEAPCDLSDAHDENFDLELQYISVAIQNDALLKWCNSCMHVNCVAMCLTDVVLCCYRNVLIVLVIVNVT